MNSAQQAEEWVHCLQANGYRLTAPRRAVVETVAASQRLLNAADIYERARVRYPKLGLVTVYRTLEKLEELDLVQRVHRPSGCQAFTASASGHQHLLICQNCGRVEYFSGDKLDALMASVAAESGFQIKEHWLQLFGVCEACQSNGSPI